MLAVMPLVAVIIIVAVILVPAAALIWRFKKDDEAVHPSPRHHQVGHGDEEDWGPHSDPPPPPAS